MMPTMVHDDDNSMSCKDAVIFMGCHCRDPSCHAIGVCMPCQRHACRFSYLCPCDVRAEVIAKFMPRSYHSHVHAEVVPY